MNHLPAGPGGAFVCHTADIDRGNPGAVRPQWVRPPGGPSLNLAARREVACRPIRVRSAENGVLRRDLRAAKLLATLRRARVRLRALNDRSTRFVYAYREFPLEFSPRRTPEGGHSPRPSE